MCTKSANYCFTTPTKNTGLILLCEVALGEMNELTNADYNASSLPQGNEVIREVFRGWELLKSSYCEWRMGGKKEWGKGGGVGIWDHGRHDVLASDGCSTRLMTWWLLLLLLLSLPAESTGVLLSTIWPQTEAMRPTTNGCANGVRFLWWSLSL